MPKKTDVPLEHPTPDDVDWEGIQNLHNDRTLVDGDEIARMCGSRNRTSAYYWIRALNNYLHKGYQHWPPDSSMLRTEVDGTGQPVAPLLHPSVLPPPDVPGGGARGADRWYRGTIYRWGMLVGRLDQTGAAIQRTAGRRKGRGGQLSRASR